jgi:3-phosphoshikimate 1-carboxyvinyltransferase
VPASKSHTNRALLLAALSNRPVRILDPLDCDDADSLISCLNTSGIGLRPAPGGLVSAPGPPPESVVTLDVRDSGTACRFLVAFAAARPGLEAVITGSPRLRERPIGPLVDALRRLGAEIRFLGREGFPPVGVRGRRLLGGVVQVASGESSQFASALLLAAVGFGAPLTVSLSGNSVSGAYLDLTVEMLAEAGIRAERSADQVRVSPGEISTEKIEIPGDCSSAVSLAAAVARVGGSLTLENLPWPSRQADAAALELLGRMGLDLELRDRGVRVSGLAVTPVNADASGFPDAVPVLCAVAAGLEGESVFSGVAHLRLKESDRLDAIGQIVKRAGARAFESEGMLRVVGPCRASGDPPIFPTRGDHRIVMAAAILSLASGGFVEDPGAVSKSYPGFFRDLFRDIFPSQVFENDTMPFLR